MTASEGPGVQPFFASASADSPAGAPRLLLVTFHFPPDIAVGGLRWQQLARYVVARGWGLDVITRDPASVDRRDESRLGQLPPNVRVYGVPTRDHPIAALPARFWKALRRRFPKSGPRVTVEFRRDEFHKQSLRSRLKRAYLARLDFLHQGTWARSAARLGASLAASHRYLAVVTSGPPHMAHEAGRLIADRARLPLVLDFRDPWSMQERVGEAMASPVWFALAERHEREVVTAAALVAMNTDASRDAMRGRYPSAAGRIITIRNGCDDEPLPNVSRADRFTIRFAGEIYIDRDPTIVFRAAARVVHELRLSPAQFGFEFIGDAHFQGRALGEIAEAEGIGGFVRTGPFRPRAEALAFLAGGTMLLSLPQDSHMAIPAKIYEYLRFDAWLLILAHQRSATAQLLAATNADVVAPNDVDAMTRVIRLRYEEFARGERPVAVASGGAFDRKLQADLLLDRISEISSDSSESP